MALFLCQNWTATRAKPADMGICGRSFASPFTGTTWLPAAPGGGRETWRNSALGFEPRQRWRAGRDWSRGVGKRGCSHAKTKYGSRARLQDWVHLHTGGRSALVDNRAAQPRRQRKGSETLPHLELDGSDTGVPLAPPIVLVDSCCEQEAPSSFSESLRSRRGAQ
jgi:hypothetical protein